MALPGQLKARVNLCSATRLGQRFAQHSSLGVASTVLLILILAISVGPLIYTASAEGTDFTQASLPPSWQHPFGTNDLGQDLLARILIGGRGSLVVGLAAMIVAVSLGTVIGAIAGFSRNCLDGLLMGLTDLFLSLPQLPIALLVIYLFSNPMKNLLGPELSAFTLIILVIGGLNWMSVARLVRAGFLATRDQTYIAAVTALGASPLRIIWQHIFPSVLGCVSVASTLAVGNAVLTEATLSFLGLGLPSDVPTWGRMLAQSIDYLDIAPQMALFPGAMICLTVMSINTLGNGLRDILSASNRG